MIGVYFKGRLGNQLFQYVFLKYVKQASKGKMVFFPNPHHAYLSRYFDLGLYDNTTLSSKIYSVLTRCTPYILKFKEKYIQTFVQPKPVDPVDFTIYYGYFQTDFYYNLLHEKPEFNIKPKYVKKFENLFGEIFRTEKTIAVHIRRTDYLSYGKRDISLPINYFKQRLEEIPDLENYRVFFVSDDVDFVKSTFQEKPNYIFSSHDEITDFQIIQNADIAIISNSSFGWWAAYLSKKKNTVYAPKNWLAFRIGAEHPKGIMTPKFIWKDVQ
ncbi:MAG: alpha-1,2-fucosyltransferase [Sphingobacteriaceae bacterium]|nr:alpha-1,2-fucosyltransferase [Sphingobacteriaceae bacterium]